MLGVQVFSALRDLYGRDGAETVSGLCGTRVVLAAPDRDTAEWSAESLGRAEIEEMAESVSYGAETPRDGVTLGARRALRPVVLPAEVARLENLSGYLKFPGPWPVALIGLDYRKRPAVAERFVAKEESRPVSGKAEAPGDDAAVCPDESGVGLEGELQIVPKVDPWEFELPVEADRWDLESISAEDERRTVAADDNNARDSARLRNDEQEVAVSTLSGGKDNAVQPGGVEESKGGETGAPEERHSVDWI